MSTNITHVITDNYILQVITLIECIFPYAHHAVGYHHTCKPAVIERIFPYAHHAVGYHHTCKPAAMEKRPTPYARHAVRHSNNIFQRILVLACVVIPSIIVSRRRIRLNIFDYHIESPYCSICMDFLTDITIHLLNSPVTPVNHNRLACVVSFC